MEFANMMFETNFMKTFVMGFIIAVLVLFFLIMSFDTKALGSRFSTYLSIFIVTVLVGFFVIFSEIRGRTLYFILFVLIVLVVLLIFHKQIFGTYIFRAISDFFWRDYPQYIGFSKETSFLIAYSLKMLLLTIILLAMSIFYNAFLNKAYQQNGMTGIIIQIIFYIPCLISDFIKYIVKDLYSTPTVVYIMLVLEVILIAMYFLIPRMLKVSISENGASLLRQPAFLSDRKTLDNCGAIMTKYMKDVNALGVPKRLQNGDSSNVNNNRPTVNNYDFAFSMWLNTNTAIDQVKYDIFFCGTNNGRLDNDKPRGKPYIRYRGSDEYEFILTDKEVDNSFTSYKMTLPTQKWNHIVLNYHHNRCDIFVNGQLVHTAKFDQGKVPVLTQDEKTIVMIGDKPENVPGGTIHGAICNIMVYRKPLTIQQIVNTYNLLHTRNPPL